MPPSLSKVFDILAEREVARRTYSASAETSPEPAFYSVAQSLKHRSSNRYSNILAYDRTAIKIGKDGYLNANVVCSRGNWWVASQAPLPSTTHDFFHAILHGYASNHPKIHAPFRGKAAIIVQLTGWQENGMLKADRYLPATKTKHGSSHLPSTKVERVSEQERPELCCTVTEARLREDTEMILYHYHFHAWPDHGVPTEVDALSKLVREVAARRKELDCEVWVHCSAGVGRTGAFIALSALMGDGINDSTSPLGPLPKELEEDEVAQTIDGIREWRGYLVQNQQQMELVYRLVNSRNW